VTVPRHHRDGAKAYAQDALRGSVSAICLPVMADGAQIDEGGLRHDIRHCLDVLGAGGVYVHGFYGHFWLLDGDTRRRALEIVVHEVRGQVPVICRCWTPSLTDTIGLARHAEQVGADMISVLGPWLGSNSDDLVYRWFEAIAAQTSLGLSVFNTPQLGYVMTPEALARVSEIPNVAAIKSHVTPAETQALRALVGDGIVVVDPDEERFLGNLLDRRQRTIFTGTNYMFDTVGQRPMHDYIDAALAGRDDLAARLYEAMQPLRDLHRTWVIEPWVETGRCPVATVKRWSQAMGMTGGGVPPPLQDLAPGERERLSTEIAVARTVSARSAAGLVEA
jgi:4-hydroxy-tetrahydrodipicolinate synthase